MVLIFHLSSWALPPGPTNCPCPGQLLAFETSRILSSHLFVVWIHIPCSQLSSFPLKVLFSISEWFIANAFIILCGWRSVGMLNMQTHLRTFPLFNKTWNIHVYGAGITHCMLNKKPFICSVFEAVCFSDVCADMRTAEIKPGKE